MKQLMKIILNKNSSPTTGDLSHSTTVKKLTLTQKNE